jgi:multidrug resistance efflux pump
VVDIIFFKSKFTDERRSNMENREEYQGKMEAQLSEWGAEIDKLKARADNAAADTRQDYCDQIEALRDKQAVMRMKLQELKTSNDGAWWDLKEGLDHSWNEIKDSFHKAAARYK